MRISRIAIALLLSLLVILSGCDNLGPALLTPAKNTSPAPSQFNIPETTTPPSPVQITVNPTQMPQTPIQSPVSTKPIATATKYTPASTPEPTSSQSPAATISPTETSQLTSVPIINTPQTPLSWEQQLEAIAASPSTELVTRTYTWDYGGQQWTWELKIPQALYDYYHALPRSPTDDYSIYVTHPLDIPYIEKLADEIQQKAQEEGYDEYETVAFMVSFVQSLPYTSDSVTTGFDEYPRYPIETLVDNGGDCEDTSILMASLLKAMNYGAVLLVFPETSDSPGHCAVGIKGGEGIYGTYWDYGGAKYYYLETTGTGWEIGEIPDEYVNSKAHIYPMIPVPILTHSWTLDAKGYLLGLHVTVSNLGSAEAQNVFVFAGFDAGNNKVWNSQESPVFSLDINESMTANLVLKPPPGEHTHLVVQIALDGYSVDESYSKWVDIPDF